MKKEVNQFRLVIFRSVCFALFIISHAIFQVDVPFGEETLNGYGLVAKFFQLFFETISVGNISTGLYALFCLSPLFLMVLSLILGKKLHFAIFGLLFWLSMFSIFHWLFFSFPFTLQWGYWLWVISVVGMSGTMFQYYDSNYGFDIV